MIMAESSTAAVRPEKRRRKIAANGPADTAANPAASNLRLYAPFRALGHVTNHVPFSMFVHSPKGALAKPSVNLVTSVGRSWMMWEAGRMGLLFVSPDSGAEISSLAQTGTEVFAASGSRVIKYTRGKPAGEYMSSTESKLSKILIFGEQLLALKEDGTGLIIWNLVSRELENEISFHPSFTATTLLHPATYLNKVLVGGTQGQLALWNIRTCTLIHTFTPSSPSISAVTSIVQSPAIDVVGVGHLDGSVRIYDIRQGESVMEMRMDSGGITALSFRMDGPPVLAGSSSTGSFALWDLSKGGRLLHVHRDAHEQSIQGLEWVAGQPLFITSSGDNSVKQWLCGSPDAAPRLLKYRSGHHAPLVHIRYYGDDGKQILTAGRDRALRYTSVVRDSRSQEMSQGAAFHKRARALEKSVAELKLPLISAISSSSTRSKDWEDVVTAHQEETSARTWRVQDRRIGPHRLEVEDGVVQAVCVTACGNFGLVGSSTGEIRLFNMQSGKERRSYSLSGLPGPSKKVNGLKPKPKTAPISKDTSAVTGLATDALNTIVIASTIEGKLYFFDFSSTRLLQEVQLPSSVTAMTLQRDSGLLCVVCDDLAVRLVDVETRRVVREMRGFRGRILDTSFSPDSRWLVTTSLDSVIRTYDIPTGRLIDAFRTPSICNSLTFSPTGDFLASAHVDSVGVHLWANRAQFTDVPLRAIDENDDLAELALPSVQGTDDSALGDLQEIGAPEFADTYHTPDQLDESLMTLSLMPRTKWQTLLNLETIRLRNKPKEPPKAPEKAPFFLPTVSGLETRFDLSAAEPNGDDIPKSQRAVPSAFLESDFTRRLAAESAEGDYAEFFDYLKGLTPSSADLEIRSLVSLDHLELFLRALVARLRSNRDYEAIQAFMSVFLTVHGDVLMANAELREPIEELRQAQKKETERLTELVSYSLGTLAFLRSSG